MLRSILIVCCTVLFVGVGYCGELYEVDDYLSAIGVDNPYRIDPPTSGTSSSFSSTSDNGGGNDPVSPKQSDPKNNSRDGNGSTGDNTGIQNYTDYGLSLGNSSYGVNVLVKHQSFIMLQTTTNIRRRSRKNKHKKITGNAIGARRGFYRNILFRMPEVADKQEAHKKVQRSIQITTVRFAQTFDVSPAYVFDGDSDVGSVVGMSLLLAA